MKVVQLREYNIDPNLALEIVELPMPQPGPDEVLVKIHAASLNPIDARVRNGYGRAIFSRRAKLPIVLGRDFSGTIIETGNQVTSLGKGDAVFGVVSPFGPQGLKQGSHAEYICVPEVNVVKKPAHLEHVQAAALPYVALTTYSALISQTGIKPQDYAGKQVFIQAGAGGVGSYAIQFLKSLGARVIATCGSANVDYLYELGADQVIDYTKTDLAKEVLSCDLAYDLLGNSYSQATLNTLKSKPPQAEADAAIDQAFTAALNQLEKADETWSLPHFKAIIENFDAALRSLIIDSPHYVSIVSPLMPLTDEKGLEAGIVEFVVDTLEQKAKQAKEHGRSFNYAFFEPNPAGLELLAEQLNSNIIQAQVGQVFALDQAVEAHRAIDAQRTRGKIVFQIN